MAEQGATTPAFSIQINGSDLPPAARGEVSRILVEESLDSAATFAMEFNNWDQENQQVKWDNHELFQPGGGVDIKLGYV